MLESDDCLICPHCGYGDYDAWELSEAADWEETWCNDCGEKFHYSKTIDYLYNYSSKKIKEN